MASLKECALIMLILLRILRNQLFERRLELSGCIAQKGTCRCGLSSLRQLQLLLLYTCTGYRPRPKVAVNNCSLLSLRIPNHRITMPYSCRYEQTRIHYAHRLIREDRLAEVRTCIAIPVAVPVAGGNMVYIKVTLSRTSTGSSQCHSLVSIR